MRVRILAVLSETRSLRKREHIRSVSFSPVKQKEQTFKKSRHISSPPPPAPVEGETSGFDKLLLNCILKNSSLSSPIFFLCALLQPRDVCATCLRVCARVYKRAGIENNDRVLRSLEFCACGFACGVFALRFVFSGV